MGSLHYRLTCPNSHVHPRHFCAINMPTCNLLWKKCSIFLKWIYTSLSLFFSMLMSYCKFWIYRVGVNTKQYDTYTKLNYWTLLHAFKMWWLFIQLTCSAYLWICIVVWVDYVVRIGYMYHLERNNFAYNVHMTIQNSFFAWLQLGSVRFGLFREEGVRDLGLLTIFSNIWWTKEDGHFHLL